MATMAVYSEAEYTLELMEASVDDLNVGGIFYKTTGLNTFNESTDAFDSEGIYKAEVSNAFVASNTLGVSVDSLDFQGMFYATAGDNTLSVSASNTFNASVDSLNPMGM